MQSYDLPLADRIKLAPYHREFQVTVSAQANKLMRLPSAIPAGIGKYQGGVLVNNCEIAIFASTVADDWKRSTTATPEEIAVATALKSVNGAFKTLGQAAFIPLGSNNLSDPLRSFFEPAGIKL